MQVELASKSMNALVILQIPETVLAGGWGGECNMRVESFVLSHSVVSNSGAPQTTAHWAPLSMGFSRQED